MDASGQGTRPPLPAERLLRQVTPSAEIGNWIGTAAGDIRIATRRLRTSPRYTLVSLLTVALAIGANGTLFSVVHGVLLSPLPFDDPQDLVVAWEARRGGSLLAGVSPLNFREWRDATTGFEAMVAARRLPYNVIGAGPPQRLTGVEITSGALALLGVRPHLGREFTPDEERPGTARVCMVSYDLWLHNLGGSQDLDSVRLLLNNEPYAVVGVLPEGLSLPPIGSQPILTPLALDPGDSGFWGNHNTVVLARLRSGVSLQQADQELGVVAARLEQAYPEWNDGIGARLVPMRDQMVQGARRNLWILFGAVALVLVIACVNIASLSLARAVESEREMAVRVALGARRARIVRLVLSEAMMLSVAGGILGLWLTYVGVDLIKAWAGGAIPRMAEVTVSVPVLAFLSAATVGTALVFGLLPALRSSSVDPRRPLQNDGGSLGSARGLRAQRILVIGEVGIAVVLLVSSGLLLRTFANLLRVDPGFEAEGRVALQLALPQESYPDRSTVTAFLERLDDELQTIPGVDASASSVGLPFQNLAWQKFMTVEGAPAATLPEVPVVDLSIVTPGWLETLGIPLRRGRDLLASDAADAPFAAVVNEAFVQAHSPQDDPIGRRVRLAAPDHLRPAGDSTEPPWYTVVGVAGNTRRWGLARDPVPGVYIPQAQDTDVAREFFVVLHTSLAPDQAVEPMRGAVLNVDPNQPVAWVRTLSDMYSGAVAGPRFNAFLIAGFGITALILATAGIYGLMANAVASRTREMGLRMALGARPRRLLTEVAGSGVKAGLIGLGLGLALSIGLTRLLGSMLFGIAPLHAGTYALVIALVLGVSVTAAGLPVWRVTKRGSFAALRQ
jgi:putative ABC transport system permease protein